MKLPTAREIEALHRKHAPSEEAFDEIWGHCEIVRQIAVWCIEHNAMTGVDRALVEAGSLLHDIGVYKLYEQVGQLDNDNYVTHGALGYEILKSEGFDEVLCRFASHHTGVGITAEEIERNNLPLPKEDFLADTVEESIVMYADKFHSKDPSRFNSIEWYKKTVSKFGEAKVGKFEAMIAEFGEPPIEELAKVSGQIVRH